MFQCVVACVLTVLIFVPLNFGGLCWGWLATLELKNSFIMAYHCFFGWEDLNHQLQKF